MNKLTVIIEDAGANYSAYIKEVDGIITVGDSIEEIKHNIKEAIDFAKESLMSNGQEIPPMISGDYVLEFKTDVKSFLNHYSKLFSKAGLEKLTGINQKQLWHYASGRSRPRKKQMERIEQAIHKMAQDMLQINF